MRVLAELNLCTPTEIVDILARGGAMSNRQAGAYRRRPKAVCAACVIQHLRRYARGRDPEELRQAMRVLRCLMRERGEPAE